MNLLQLKTVEPGAVSCATFFEVGCREALAHASPAAGRVSFVLSGLAGGTWTLDFEARTVTKRAHPDATRIVMGADDFSAWLGGDYDVVVAALEGTVRVEGPLSGLRAFNSFLRETARGGPTG